MFGQGMSGDERPTWCGSRVKAMDSELLRRKSRAETHLDHFRGRPVPLAAVLSTGFCHGDACENGASQISMCQLNDLGFTTSWLSLNTLRRPCERRSFFSVFGKANSAMEKMTSCAWKVRMAVSSDFGRPNHPKWHVILFDHMNGHDKRCRRERRAMGYQEVAWYPAISGILIKLEMMINPIFVDRYYSI